MHQRKKSTTTQKEGRDAAKPSVGIPLIIIFWAGGLGGLAYIVSRFVVSEHPLHWLSGLGGILLGCAIGYIWFLKRGDVIPF